MPDEVPRDLLERFVRGDDQAFESLFRLFEREVYRWIATCVHGWALARLVAGDCEAEASYQAMVMD